MHRKATPPAATQSFFEIGAGALIQAALAAVMLLWAATTVRNHVRLRAHGEIADGLLETATLRRTNFIPTAYELTIRFRGREETLNVSRSLFLAYVRDERFTRNAPVSVVYFPEDESIAMPTEMLGVWMYWGTPLWQIAGLIVFGGGAIASAVLARRAYGTGVRR